MARPSSIFTFLPLLAAALPAACYDLNDIRRGGKGESCARTDDCQAPLVCIQLTCVEPGGSGGSGGGTTITTITGSEGGGGSGGETSTATGGAGGSGGATTTTTGSGGSGGLDPEVCATCIDTACTAELAACDDGCVAIDACIQMLCAYLSSIGAAQEEGLCQQHCQQPHPGSKQKHIAVVDCAITAWPDCDACSSYPFDYNACVEKASAGPCLSGLEACNASADCTQYRECVGSCSTLAACLACDDTPEGQAGKVLLTEYNVCLSTECLPEAWLP